jgi:hypothetical protein
MRKARSYREIYPAAFLAASVYNMFKGKKDAAAKPEDYIGEPPWKNKQNAKETAPDDPAAEQALIEDARAKGLSGPW